MPDGSAHVAADVYEGPTFELVETTRWTDLVQSGGFGVRKAPLLVKGVVRTWPASDRWTFERLAALRRPDGSDVVFRFQNGLVEQGVTREPLDLPIGPYLDGLARASLQPVDQETGLLPA